MNLDVNPRNTSNMSEDVIPGIEGSPELYLWRSVIHQLVSDVEKACKNHKAKKDQLSMARLVELRHHAKSSHMGMICELANITQTKVLDVIDNKILVHWDTKSYPVFSQVIQNDRYEY